MILRRLNITPVSPKKLRAIFAVLGSAVGAIGLAAIMCRLMHKGGADRGTQLSDPSAEGLSPLVVADLSSHSSTGRGAQLSDPSAKGLSSPVGVELSSGGVDLFESALLFIEANNLYFI